MDATKQSPRIQLKNHLVTVRKSGGILPVADQTAHFQQLHDTYLHEVDGEDCWEVPVGVILRHIQERKDSFGALTALLDILANRGISHNISAIKAGSVDPAEVLRVVWDDEMQAPAQFSVKNAQGKEIIPLDLLDVCRIYGVHHAHVGQEVHKKIPSLGGQMSRDAIEALDALLAEIGLQPNHAVIRRRFCSNCQGKGNAALQPAG